MNNPNQKFYNEEHKPELLPQEDEAENEGLEDNNSLDVQYQDNDSDKRSNSQSEDRGSDEDEEREAHGKLLQSKEESGTSGQGQKPRHQKLPQGHEPEGRKKFQKSGVKPDRGSEHYQ